MFTASGASYSVLRLINRQRRRRFLISGASRYQDEPVVAVAVEQEAVAEATEFVFTTSNRTSWKLSSGRARENCRENRSATTATSACDASPLTFRSIGLLSDCKTLLASDRVGVGLLDTGADLFFDDNADLRYHQSYCGRGRE